ncbi:MAG: helix-turn-helix transcriptional regulator [Pseudomonadota bacterium]
MKGKQMDERNVDREIHRGVVRSMFLSLFGVIAQHQKKRDRLNQQEIADRMHVDKSQISRWFRDPPNWQLNTIADLETALKVRLEISAVDMIDGTVYKPSGVEPRPAVTTSKIDRTNPSDSPISGSSFYQSEDRPRLVRMTP